MILSDLYVDRCIEADSWHHTTHELQKYHESLVRFDLLAVFFSLIYEIFHNIRVFTRMDCDHPTIYLNQIIYLRMDVSPQSLSNSDIRQWCLKIFVCLTVVYLAYRCQTATAWEYGSSRRKLCRRCKYGNLVIFVLGFLLLEWGSRQQVPQKYPRYGCSLFGTYWLLQSIGTAYFGLVRFLMAWRGLFTIASRNWSVGHQLR